MIARSMAAGALRRLPTVAVGAAVLPLAVGAPASAATVAHLSDTGRLAAGHWTTCADGGTAGSTCTDTLIISTLQRTDAGDAPAMTFEQVRYLVEPERRRLLSSTTLSGPADVSVDRNLASAAATMRNASGHECSYPIEGGAQCQDVGSAAVTATWTAAGSLQRSVTTDTPDGDNRGSNFAIGLERATLRSASASASRDGGGVPGQLVEAVIVHQASRLTVVCRHDVESCLP